MDSIVSNAGAQGASTEARGTSPDIWSHKHTAMQPCQLARNTAIVYLPFSPPAGEQKAVWLGRRSASGYTAL